MTKSARLKHVKTWRESGLSKKAYCESQGLTYCTFLTWFKLEKEAEPPGRFVMIPAESDKTSMEIVFPNGIRLYYQAELSLQLLRSLQDA